MNGFAYAQAGGGGLEALNSLLIPTILIIGIMYFLMIRPQQKRMKEHKAKVGAVRRGDKVALIAPAAHSYSTSTAFVPGSSSQVNPALGPRSTTSAYPATPSTSEGRSTAGSWSRSTGTTGCG